MQKLISQKVIPTTAISANQANLNVTNTLKGKGNADTEVVEASVSINYPFYLSMCVNNWDSIQNFYNSIFSIEKRQPKKSLVHFDFYGCQRSFSFLS